MDFKANDTVMILSLRKKGTVEEVLKNNRFRVLAGGMRIICKGSDLQPAKAGAKAPDRSGTITLDGHSLDNLPQKDFILIDLHGLTVSEALSKVEDAVNSALLDHRRGIKIMHGIGSGKVKNAVHTCLSGLAAVTTYKLSPDNPGMTVVYF